MGLTGPGLPAQTAQATQARRQGGGRGGTTTPPLVRSVPLNAETVPLNADIIVE